MTTHAGPPAGPIVAYRWFQLRLDDYVSGAQNEPWPLTGPLRASHVAAFTAADRVTRALIVFLYAVMAVGSVLFAAGTVRLMALAFTAPAEVAALAAMFALICLAFTVVMVTMVTVRSPLPWPRRRHVCPARPARLFASWVPECGIYGFSDVDRAVRAARREGRFLTQPVVVARVTLWGQTYVYENGYRAEWARIEAFFDDGSGRVEMPAVRYGVPVEPFPPGTAVPRLHRAGRIRRASITIGRSLQRTRRRRR